MRKMLPFALLFTGLYLFVATTSYAAANVTLTSSAVTSANINQGSDNNIVYAVKMDVTSEDVTVNKINFTLTGTHDADDLEYVYVYFNATGPTLSGATYLTYAAAAFASGHDYALNINKLMAAGTSGYFIITAYVEELATDNHTITINAGTDPVSFGYSAAPNITDNQAGSGGTLTVQAADITYSSSPITDADINQGTSNTMVYAVKMDVTTEDVTVNQINFTMTGTHDADDLDYVYVYYNTSPTLTGATYLTYTAATFAGGHDYSLNINKAMPAGSGGYFILSAYLDAVATDNHTITIDADADPVTFGYTTQPNVTDNQSGAGGTLSIQAGDITYASSHITDTDINQGTSNNMLYAVKMDVTTEDVTVNKINFTMTGTHDNNDLEYVYVYYNTTPSLTGATYLTYTAATFAGGHDYSLNINKAMPAGSSGYFILSVYLDEIATDNNTITVDADADPVSFGYTTAPNVTDNQSGAGGTLTIQAADITYASSHITDADINQGTSNNMLYAVKMDVVTEDVTVNKINFTMTGTHDNNDLEYVYVYYNTTPSLTGATYLTYTAATFAGGHDYSLNINKAMPAGSSGYFILSVYLDEIATDNNTITVDADANPVSFGYTTAPNVTDNQSGAGGTLTIQAADITYASSHITDADINQGSDNNMLYAVKMDVATEDVTVNKINFTMTGTHDNNDLEYVYVYYNTTPSLTGATYLTYTAATFAGGHDYSLNIKKAMPAGSSGYFILSVYIDEIATDNNTITIDADANPVSFGYTTAPNLTDNEAGAGGTLTIQAADITMATSSTPANNILPGTTGNIVYALDVDVATEPVTINNIQFTLSGTHDNNDLDYVYIYFNASAPTLTGASYVTYADAKFAGGHDYSLNISKAMDAGTGGYFLISVNVATAATLGNTVYIDGEADPVTLGYTTAPNIVDNQSNDAGVKTISDVLPVSLINFTGNMSNKAVQLNWQTRTENNNKGFFIERSSNGVTFTTVGFVPSKAPGGNSTIALSYSLLDGQPVAGDNFYRIRQVDKDDKFTYSAIVIVKNSYIYSKLVKVYPNPARTIVNLYIETMDTRMINFVIVDNNGRLIKQQQASLVAGSNNIQVDVTHLPAGSYMIKFVDDGNFRDMTQRFIKY